MMPLSVSLISPLPSISVDSCVCSSVDNVDAHHFLEGITSSLACVAIFKLFHFHINLNLLKNQDSFVARSFLTKRQKQKSQFQKEKQTFQHNVSE